MRLRKDISQAIQATNLKFSGELGLIKVVVMNEGICQSLLGEKMVTDYVCRF